MVVRRLWLASMLCSVIRQDFPSYPLPGELFIQQFHPSVAANLEHCPRPQFESRPVP